MSDIACTLFLVPSNGRAIAMAAAVRFALMPLARRVAGTLWLADQTPPEGWGQPAYAAVVAVCGEAGIVRNGLADFGALPLPSSARCFKDETLASPGRNTSGVSLLSLIVPRPELDRDEAIRRWREHAPLALAVHHGARRYTQYELPGGATAPSGHVGMANLHFDSLENVTGKMFREPADTRLITDDIARFVASTETFLTSEYVFGVEASGQAESEQHAEEP